MAVACVHVCDQLAIGVIACDVEMRILGLSPTAQAVLSTFGADSPFCDRLPRAVADAARVYLARVDEMPGQARVAPIRVQTPDGARAVHVASKRVDHSPPLAVVVRVHEDEFADEDLFRALRGAFQLSPRDRRLIALLRRGSSSAQMAQTLGLTPGTLKVYLHELYGKFDVHSRWQLLALFERIRAER